MDPLLKIKNARHNGILPAKLFSLLEKRFPIVIAGINRIEKTSGIHYPIAYVEPSTVITSSNSYDYGILFARTIPIIINDHLQIVIQLTAPLVAYGLKGTIHAILAHEFLHYLELIRKASKMEILSDEISGNLFENVYADSTRLFEPKVVFHDKTLLSHITKKFPVGFRDFKLEDKTIKLWIAKKLPTTNITLDSNVIKVSAESLAKIKLDSKLLEKLKKLEEKSSMTKRKKLY